MSAKKKSKSETPATAGAAGASARHAEPSTDPWIGSADPTRRLVGKVVVAALWIYVAALVFLALDQSLNWGIFGPKIPPVP